MSGPSSTEIAGFFGSATARGVPTHATLARLMQKSAVRYGGRMGPCIPHAPKRGSPHFAHAGSPYPALDRAPRLTPSAGGTSSPFLAISDGCEEGDFNHPAR